MTTFVTLLGTKHECKATPGYYSSYSRCPYLAQYGTGPSCQSSSEAVSAHPLSCPPEKTEHSFP